MASCTTCSIGNRSSSAFLSSPTYITSQSSFCETKIACEYDLTLFAVSFVTDLVSIQTGAIDGDTAINPTILANMIVTISSLNLIVTTFMNQVHSLKSPVYACIKTAIANVYAQLLAYLLLLISTSTDPLPNSLIQVQLTYIEPIVCYLLNSKVYEGPCADILSIVAVAWYKEVLNIILELNVPSITELKQAIQSISNCCGLSTLPDFPSIQ